MIDLFGEEFLDGTIQMRPGYQYSFCVTPRENKSEPPEFAQSALDPVTSMRLESHPSQHVCTLVYTRSTVTDSFETVSIEVKNVQSLPTGNLAIALDCIQQYTSADHPHACGWSAPYGGLIAGSTPLYRHV